MCFARQALKFTCSGFSHSFRIPAGLMTFFYRFGRYDRYDRYIQSVGWRWVGGSEPRESRKGSWVGGWVWARG